MADATPTSPLQLRDGMRKMRKRVVSAIRRTNSSKSGKSGSPSEEPNGRLSQTPSKSGHSHDDSEHEHEHERGRKGAHDGEHTEGEDQHSQHSGSATSSAAPSLRRSASSRFGSRSGSPQPTTSPQTAVTPTQATSNSHLAPPPNTHRFSMPHLGFPRSASSRRSKSKQRDGPHSGSESPPAVRTRTVSTPTGPSLIMTSVAAAADVGMLTVPIPVRPRTLSHPLAASPIMPASPSATGDSRFMPAVSPPTQPTAGEQENASGAAPVPAPAPISEVLDTVKQEEATGSPIPTASGAASPPPTMLVDSPTAVDVASPAPVSDVISSPPMSDVPSSPPVPDVVSAPAPDVFTAPTPVATPTAEAEAREPLVGHARESSGGHVREHGSALSRAASTVGSDLGWSILEPTKEEDEPEDEVTNKKNILEELKVKEADVVKNAEGQKDESVQVKIEEVPVKLEELTPKIEEPAVKVEEIPAKVDEVSAQVEEASINTSESAVKVEKDDAALDHLVQNILDKDFQQKNPICSHANSEGRTPLAEGGDDDAEGAKILEDREIVGSPEPEGTEKDIHSRLASQEATSDLGSSGVFVENPSTLPVPPRTPPKQTGKAFMSAHDSTFSTPEDPSPDSRFSGEDTPLRFATSTPSRLAGTDTPPRFAGTETPPRPGMASSYGSYTGDRTSPPPALHMSESFFHPRNVERLNPRHFERSMSTMGVFGDADPDGAGVQERLLGEPLPLIDTVLESEVSVHDLVSPNVRGEQEAEQSDIRKLAGTELKDWYEGPGRTPKSVRMLLPEDEREGEDGASGVPTRPHSALSQSETAEESQLQAPAQPLTQEVLQPQSDRAQLYSAVLSRLITHMDRRSSLMSRLATRLGSLGNGLTAPERHPREWIAQVLPSGKIYYAHRIVADDERINNNEVARAGASNEVAKVLVIPTPSAPQPVTLVTDLDMSDNTTHAGVNAFVDKCLQERNTDLPNGWEVWVHASGEGERLLDTSSERWEEGSEGGESVDLGYGAPCVLVWSYVSHKRRRVGSQGPDDKFVTGEDAELDLEMERRYWAYVETHPAHADVNLRAVQEAIELLTWHYTDRLLAEKKPSGEKEYVHVKPPFTPEESHEVLEFLKSLSADYSISNAVLKTRTVARVHVRTAEWRLAKLHAVTDAVNLQVMSPSERARRRRAAANPFIGVPLRTLAGLLGLGIPYLYVDQPDEKVEDRQRLMVADASTNLMSALMLGASVSFLAIPDLEDIARLAGVAAAACSLGSLAAGIVRLRMPFSRTGNAEDASEEDPRPSALRTFARSLPLVLSAYAGSALVAGLAAYSWRGQVSSVDDPFARLYLDDSWRSDSSGSRWLGGLVRRDGGSGNGIGGIGLEQGRQGWSEASTQGVVRLWGSW